MLAISAIGALSYNSEVKNFMTSVLHSPSDSSQNIFSLDKKEEAEIILIPGAQNKGKLNFEIKKDKEKGFAAPGEKGAYVMEFEVKTFDKKFILKNVKFKISGVESDKIEGGRMITGEEDITILSEAKRKNEYLNFKNIDFVLEKNSQATIKIMLDLSENLKTGERIRLDIETPDDIKSYLGKDSYPVFKRYPVKGEYLSISKARTGKKK